MIEFFSFLSFLFADKGNKYKSIKRQKRKKYMLKHGEFLKILSIFAAVYNYNEWEKII